MPKGDEAINDVIEVHEKDSVDTHISREDSEAIGHVYKHIYENIQAVVHPETLELLGKQSNKLLVYLKTNNETIKSLIKMGIFSKFVEPKDK